jgi:hypothetical protein
VEELVGPKIWSSQEINLFPVASSFELGFDGKVERSAWDCSEMEYGLASPLLVRVAVSGRRKKMKNFGLLGLGLGLGKMGLGVSRLGSRSVGPGPGSVSGSSRLVLGSDFGSNVFSRRIPVSSMGVNEQIHSEVFEEQSHRPEVTGSLSMMSSYSTVFDEQSLRSEVSGSSLTVTSLLSVSLTSSVWTDDDGSSTVVFGTLEPVLSIGFAESLTKFADDGSSTEAADDGSSTVVPVTLEPVLSTGFAESDCFGDATAEKPLDDSFRKDMQAWFFGWLRAAVQHDKKLLAKLEVIVENTSRANLAIPPPARSTNMLRMREKLESFDAARMQDMAIVWVQALSGQGDM